MKSLPAWECGLKSSGIESNRLRPDVTPCVGVWIEIKDNEDEVSANSVTPCVGVWIEISGGYSIDEVRKGHSLRGSVD